MYASISNFVDEAMKKYFRENCLQSTFNGKTSKDFDFTEPLT